jgi:cell division protein FtsX
VKAWLHAHGEALALTLRQFRRRPVAAFLGVTVIAVGLLFPVGGYVAMSNLKGLAGAAGADPQIILFLTADAGAADRSEIERRLRLESGQELPVRRGDAALRTCRPGPAPAT